MSAPMDARKILRLCPPDVTRVSLIGDGPWVVCLWRGEQKTRIEVSLSETSRPLQELVKIWSAA